MPDPSPEPVPTPPDPVEERAFLEMERIRHEAEELRRQTDQLKSRNQTLSAQVEELKGLAATTDDVPNDIRRLHLLQIQPIRDILVILLVFGIFWLGYILRSITVPMLLALTLAYLVEPVVQTVVRKGWMNRLQAATSVIILVVLIITVPLGIGTTVAISQGYTYSQSVTRNVGYIQKLIENPKEERYKALLERSGKGWRWLGETISGYANPEPTAEEIEAERQKQEGASPTPPPTPPGEPAGGASQPDPEPAETPSPLAPPAGDLKEEVEPGGSKSKQALSWITTRFEQNLQGLGRMVARYLVGTGANAVEIGIKTVKMVVYLGFALFLVLFFFFFFSTGYERVTTSIANLIPKWKRNRTLELLRQMDAVIAGFVRGRLIIMGILMVAFTIGYWLIGVPGALIVGPITGVLAVVPYLGLVSIPTAMVLMWLQPVGPAWQQTWWWIVIAPIALYFIIQTVEDYVLTPMIQGKATDMDTPSILFAVLAGGILAGFYGVLLAIPAAACIKILLREAFWPRFKAWAEGKVKDFLPISRYDPTEAGIASPTPAEPKA
jgi:predicted PurR-regulated permease PerM